MMIQAILVASCIISFVIAVGSGIIGVIALVELRSFMKSTHRVQMVPMKVDEIKMQEVQEKFDGEEELWS